MKNIIALAIALLPVAGMAQNNNTSTVSGDKDEQRGSFVFKEDPRKKEEYYLAGAVPEVDGKVVFSIQHDVKGLSQAEVYKCFQKFLKHTMVDPRQLEGTKIVRQNDGSAYVLAHFKEQMIFTKSALSTDFTIVDYDLEAKCTDGQIEMKLFNIKFTYEMEREDGDGMLVPAEDWITDQHALNKKGTKLRKYRAKFRIGTVNRKDEIFSDLLKAFEA